MYFSLIAAVTGSLAMGAAAILQAVGARRTRTLAAVWHPLYLSGMVLDVVGWGLSVLAMRHLPLLAVQTILAASLAVTVVLGALVLRLRPSRGVWLAVAAVCLAAVVLVVAAEPGPPATPPAWFTPAAAVFLGATVAAAVWAYRRPRTARCAIVAGLGYSGAAVAARAVHGSDLTQILVEPLVWMILGFAAVGAVLFARALSTHDDAVNEASAWLWVIEITLPSAVGLLVLGDLLRPGWALPAALAVVFAVVATLRISSSGTLA